MDVYNLAVVIAENGCQLIDSEIAAAILARAHKALVDERDQLKSRVKELEEALGSAVKIADEAADEWDKAPSGMRAGKILLALAGHVPGYRPDTDKIHQVRRASTSIRAVK